MTSIRKNYATNTSSLTGEEKRYARVKKAVLEEDIINFENNLKQAYGTKEIHINKYFKIAAFIILLASLSFVAYYCIPENNRIFLSDYNVYPENRISNIYRNAEASDAQGVNYYISEKYIEAIPYFIKALESQPDNYEIKLLLGISYIEIDKYDLSKNNLEQIITAPLNFYTDDALWYLSLLNIKELDYVEAEKYLLRVKASSEHFRSAQKLRKKIGKKD